MQYYGYMGKILYVDLTSGNIREEDLDLDLARKYIGDFGIGARLIYDLIKPGIDPLGPENPIVIGAGPLCGTSYPGTSRCTVWTKYPLTNTIGHGNGGQDFAAMLKYAGFDGLIITGRSDKPVYLKISDDNVEICDASDLWGRDIYEATDEIWKKHGTDCSVLCIGQASENLAKISMAFINKSSSVGRSGFGAVMGSKNLKLVITSGKKMVKVHDHKKFSRLSNQMLISVKNSPIRKPQHKLGHTEFFFDIWNRFATKNYYSELRSNLDAAREKFGPKPYLQRIKKVRYSCISCSQACKSIDEIRQGEYKGLTIFSSHTMYTPGVAFDFDNFEESIRCAQLFQKYGIEMFALLKHVEFLMELHKQGIVSKDDLEGLDFSEKSISGLVEKIAFRRGIGDAIADGLP